jgi:hypothetical protein
MNIEKCEDPAPPGGDCCQLPKGHSCPHFNGVSEWNEPCSVCRSRDGVRRFSVIVGGEELVSSVVLLCNDHGTRHLLNIGRVLGELFASRRFECGDAFEREKCR